MLRLCEGWAFQQPEQPPPRGPDVAQPTAAAAAQRCAGASDFYDWQALRFSFRTAPWPCAQARAGFVAWACAAQRPKPTVQAHGIPAVETIWSSGMPSLALPAAPRRLLLSTLWCLTLAWSAAPSYGAPSVTASQPQTDSVATVAPTTTISTGGRSRAEVIAELACARASGELEAMVLRSYGQPTPRLRPEACVAPRTSAQADPAAMQPMRQSAR